MKSSEDIKPISYIKQHTNKVLDQLRKTGRPIVITQHGEPAAILEDVHSYEERQETAALLELVRQGIADIKAGKVVNHEDVLESVKENLSK